MQQPNQWQQQQYQYAQQTGNPNQGYGNPSYLSQQPTGFPQGMQPMQTGFQPQQQQQQQQQRPPMPSAPTGNYSFLSQPPPSSFRSQQGMQSQMTGFPGGGASGLMPQQTGYPGGGMMSQPTGMGMMSQPTGYAGGLTSQQTGMGRLQPQPTGMPHDPRLISLTQSFLPSNLSQPFAPSGVPQFANQNAPLTQQFQSLLQNPSVNTPKIPWALSRQEKKDYDQIFRAWDTKGDGFIPGEMAREVFGQSGLNDGDLMKIWNLSDVDNRGKLNLPEFHVAMGLIYRALNGNPIPETLPEELVPASMRDIDTTVNFMKDLLRHEASSRSNTSSPSYGGTPVSAAASKDALMYKHSDERPSTYKPSSRHLDRKSVRYSGEDPDAGLQDIRRKLQNTSTLLEKSAEKSTEDEELEEEIENLQYRVKRIQDDIEYTSKGRRTAEKDEERRKLERELLFLMHEKLPELERRQERRKEERAMEERAGVRRRDDRNRTAGRYDDRDEYDRDRYRGTFDRERSKDRYDDRDRYERRDSRDRYDSYDRDRRDEPRDRRGSYERPRSPPPAPPPASVAAATSAPPPPPAPATNASVPSTKNMTPEERKAYIREQAQRRINERLRALGVETAPTESAVDSSVQDRLELEKKEAEEKSKKAEEEQAARDEARRKRLAEAGGATEEEKPPASAAPAPPSPAQPVKSAMKKPAAPPPAPHSRAKGPPPAPSSRTAAPPPPPAPKAPAPPEEDPEEVELRQREEAAAKARAERKARLEALQREEEEERKHEEALLAARQNRSKGPSPAMSTPVAESAPPPPPPPPPAPPAPPADTSYNPFRKPSGAAAVASPPPAAPAAGGFNPFFKPQSAYSTPTGGQTPSIDAPSAAPPPPPAPPAPPAPPPAAAQTSRAPVRSPPSEPEWEDITEKQVDSDDDSSDDEYTSSRAGRQGLAQALFGNILPASMLPGGGSRPSSAAPSSPVAPKAPPAAVANLGGGNPEQSRGALLSAIQGGARLRKAQTVDKSGPGAAGKVVGDASPPEHIKNAPRPASPAAAAAEADESFNVNPHRQSVDWYQGLAADATHPAASLSENHVLEPTKEEDEPVPAGLTNGNALAPEINVENGDASDDLEENFDLSTTLRVRSLYEFQGTRDVDLSFKENVVILAHPAKDQSSDWWYGLSVKEGSKGWFPKSYVEEMTVTRAKAMYEYAAGEEDQLPFAEGDILEIVDKSDADWWKTEKAGVIFLVPAAYLEVIQGDTSSADVETNKERGLAADPGPLESVTEHRSVDREHYRVETADSVGLANANGGDIDLRVPRPAERPRPVSLLSVNSTGIPHSPILVTDDEGYSSSDDDSVLSWWSDDEDRSSHSEGVDDDEATGTDVGHHVKEKEREDGERKRREEERQKILSAVGLQLKREPPGVPTRPPGRIASRRRPAPGVPKKHKERRRAPAVPSPDKTKKLPLFPSASISNLDLTTSPTVGEEEEEEEEANKSPKLETQDAYARYEAYLAQSQSKSQAQPLPTPSSAVRDGQSSYSRPVSQIMTTPQLSDPVQTPQSPTPSTTLSLSTSLGKESSSGGGAGGRLSGFMSRLIGPLPHHHTGNGSNSGKPTISGPIVTRLRADSDLTRPPTPGTPILLGTPLGPGAGGADESFGKTWSSLVEPGIVETMGQRERKRQEAIFEFIATEGGYNRDLQLIVEVFYASLLSILDDKALTVIFANIEDILLFNTSFLSSLEGRQRSCRLYIDRIGDVLEEHLANAGVYMTYCVNQHQAIKLLQSLRESNPELSSHLQNIRETNPAVRGLDLSSFLLIPMQRITRYPLLIKQIISYTDLDCDAASDLPLVSSALRTVEGIVGQINESVREAEGEERLRVLSEDLWIGGEGRLDLTAPTMFMGPRRLLKEGKVSKAKSGRKLTMVLCNDIVVLLDERDLYRMPLPLHEVQVKQGRDELGFVLKVDQRRGGDLIALRAPTARDAKDWMMLLGKARARAVEARRGAA